MYSVSVDMLPAQLANIEELDDNEPEDKDMDDKEPANDDAPLQKDTDDKEPADTESGPLDEESDKEFHEPLEEKIAVPIKPLPEVADKPPKEIGSSSIKKLDQPDGGPIVRPIVRPEPRKSKAKKLNTKEPSKTIRDPIPPQKDRIKFHTKEFPFTKELGNAGYDLYARIESKIKLSPQSRGIIPTGIYIECPPSIYGQIYSKSSRAKLGIDVSAGVVDSSYRGEIGVLLVNNTSNREFIINPGDAIAQIVFHRIVDEPELIGVKSVSELTDTSRKDRGFGGHGLPKI